jgi:putative ABC transport system permease protein
MDSLLQDLRFAVRQLLKRPLFAIVAILTLALGIGANTAIFSIVHSVLLQRLPFADPERMVIVYEQWRGQDANVSVGNYADWVAQNRVFEQLAAFSGSSFNLTGRGEPERLYGAQVTANYFKVAQLAPALGRYFLPDEDRPGRDRVVVLSHSLWVRRFGADSSIVGREIGLDGQKYTVIGVAPRHFTLASSDEALWVPLSFTPAQLAQHDEHYLLVIGKLKRNVSQAMAQSEMTPIMTAISRQYPTQTPDRTVRVADYREELVGDYRTQLLVLAGAVAFVLLIACGNIANLLLARASARQKEIALRTALGAHSRRIVRQLLTESLLLALAGGVAGVMVGYIALRFLVHASPAGVPRLDDAGLSAPVLAFTLGLTLLSGIIFGLVPMIRSRRLDLQSTLREGGQSSSMGSSRDRLRSTLVVAEVAVALVLLAAAGLFIRSMQLLQRVDPGFDPSNVLSARIALPEGGYAEPVAVERAFERMLDDVGALPGVRSAALISRPPMAGAASSNGLVIEGRSRDQRDLINGEFHLVSPSYFQTMRIAVKSGRAFTPQDDANASRVMIINETLARRAWPGQSAIGKRIACCDGTPDSPNWKEVVGVVGDVHSAGLGEQVAAEFYLPVTQAPARSWDWIERSMSLVLRTAADPAGLARGVRQAVWSVDPATPVFDLQTLDQLLVRSTASTRFNMMLLSVLGAVGLLLAAVGVYGVIAYSVSQRTREIGVRMALGAAPERVATLVLRQGAALAAAGIGIGVALAVIATRALSGLLFGVTSNDPGTYLGVGVLLGVVALLASYLPARRAARVDPIIALRSE